MDEATTQRREVDPWAAFGLGVLGGVVGGLVLLSLGTILLALVILVFAGGLGLRPPFGAAGILGGWGATWLALLASAAARCDPSSCVGSDLTPLIAFGVTLVVVAVALLVLGIRRPRWAVRLRQGAIERWRSSRAVRLAFAITMGAATGLALGTFWTGGWAIAALVVVLFARTRLAPGRRWELLGFGIGVVAILALLIGR